MYSSYLIKLFLAAFAFFVTSFTSIAPNATAQAPSPPQTNQKLTFDVASIKSWQPNQPLPKIMTGIRFSVGSIYATCATLNSLVHYAYHLGISGQVSGFPAWAQVPCGPDTFSLEATMSPETTQDQSRQMMQALLEDRFKLRVHWEKKEMPVFFLVAGPGGPKLTHYDPKASRPVNHESLACPEDDPGCSGHFGRSTMSELADRLGFGIGPRRPVIDKTGLSGEYVLNFIWASENAEASSLPSLATALRENFNLLLKPETAPIDILVIDHVEKPSPN